MNEDLNTERGSARFGELGEERLEAAQRRLSRLRHQPLDPHVLDHVTRAEREAERWSRIAGALARTRTPVALTEDPGSMMARVLNEVRESWRGTGLQVTGSFRKLDPQSFDRRVYMEAIRCSIDFVLSAFARPRTLEGHLTQDGALQVELRAAGNGLRVDDEELELTRHVADRAGCALDILVDETTIAGSLLLGARRRLSARPRYIFELKAG